MGEYAKKDKRIKSIHKENRGYSSAVNLGIEKSYWRIYSDARNGRLDEPNAYELLYNESKINDTDMRKCKFIFIILS